jgi:hypothetical protein
VSAVADRVLVLALGGAGGDLPPLLAAALALRGNHHEVAFAGDESVAQVLRRLDVPVEVLPRELDLGPRLVAAIQDAMAATGGELVAAGPLVRERMTAWAREVARAFGTIARKRSPAVIATSLFGVQVLHVAAPSCPWAVVNSTFYIGPDPPRPFEADFGPRAIPLTAGYAALLGSADLVLHATDPRLRLFLRSPPRPSPLRRPARDLGASERAPALPQH